MDTRTSLLNSAEKACRSLGYNGFSYATLASEVGIRKASIHHHFPSKTDLIAALIKRYSELFFKRLTKLSEQGLSAAETLHAYLEIYREASQNGEAVCLCVALSADRDALPDEALEWLSIFHQGSLDWLTVIFHRALKDGSVIGVQDPEMEAHSALALVEGAHLLARSAKNISAYDKAVAALTARLNPNKYRTS